MTPFVTKLNSTQATRVCYLTNQIAVSVGILAMHNFSLHANTCIIVILDDNMWCFVLLRYACSDVTVTVAPQILKDAMAYYQEDKEKRVTDLTSESESQLAYSTSYACHKVSDCLQCT